MCRYEDENEDEHQCFGSFWNLCMTNKPILQCIIVLRACFVCHRLYPERTKTFAFWFVFVFVLAQEQPISTNVIRFSQKQEIFIYLTPCRGWEHLPYAQLMFEEHNWSEPTKECIMKMKDKTTGYITRTFNPSDVEDTLNDRAGQKCSSVFSLVKNH